MNLEYTIQCLIQTSPTLVSVLCDQWYAKYYVFAGPQYHYTDHNN